MLQRNLPSSQTKADRTTYLASCRVFALPLSGAVLNYPCLELYTKSLCRVVSIYLRHERAWGGRAGGEREKRGNSGKLENLVILFAQSIFLPLHLSTHSSLTPLLFNVLPKPGRTEAGRKSFTCRAPTQSPLPLTYTTHSAAQIPKPSSKTESQGGKVC